MSRRRAWLAAALAISSAVGGMTVVSATPAAAAAGNTTLTCELKPEVPGASDAAFVCLMSDPDGIRTIGFHYGPENDYTGTDGFFGEFCNDPDLRATTVNYEITPATRLKFFITDCSTPRSHATFVVRNDGTVKEIRNN